MHFHHSEDCRAFAIRALIAASSVLYALNIHAQEAVAAANVTSCDTYHRTGDRWISTFWNQPQRTAEKSASLGFLGFTQPEATVSASVSATTDLSDVAQMEVHEFDLVDESSRMVRPSSDPFEFAASVMGFAPQFEQVIRGGPAVPDTVWMGLTPDTGWKHGSNFEAGMTAQFVCGKKARYPVIVRLPLYLAASDEQYILGPHYGYVTAGINLRVPLRFISPRYGNWSAGGNADFCYYGTTTSEFIRSIGLQIPKVAAVLSVDL